MVSDSKKMCIYSLSIAMLFLSIFSMFFVKYTLYSLKKDIVSLDNEIQRNIEEKQILEAEWSYLTTPERLKKLLTSNKDNYIVVKVEQIKKLKALKPYYLAKSEKAGNNNLALQSSSNELYY